MARESPDLNMDFHTFDNGLNSYTNRSLCKIKWLTNTLCIYF